MYSETYSTIKYIPAVHTKEEYRIIQKKERPYKSIDAFLVVVRFSKRIKMNKLLSNNSFSVEKESG